MSSADFLRELVANPREALAIEIKGWIDPLTPEGEAKIAKCVLALRNHGGGFMVVGFDDVSSAPLAVGRPGDVRTAFHADTIQLIATRYASESFEVTVHFPEREGVEFPVIEVPPGVRTPVAAKCDLIGGVQTLIRKDALFVRSLNSNGVVSSSVAGWKDWPRLVEVCFDNREADIGRFLRRHLSAASGKALQVFLSELEKPKLRKTKRPNLKAGRPPAITKRRLGSTVSNVEVPVTPLVEPAPERYRQRLEAIINAGLQRFRAVVVERQVNLPPHGSWEIAAVVRGAPVTNCRATVILTPLRH